MYQLYITIKYAEEWIKFILKNSIEQPLLHPYKNIRFTQTHWNESFDFEKKNERSNLTNSTCIDHKNSNAPFPIRKRG